VDKNIVRNPYGRYGKIKSKWKENEIWQ
jgi:hypothetical protein